MSNVIQTFQASDQILFGHRDLLRNGVTPDMLATFQQSPLSCYQRYVEEWHCRKLPLSMHVEAGLDWALSRYSQQRKVNVDKLLRDYEDIWRREVLYRQDEDYDLHRKAAAAIKDIIKQNHTDFRKFSGKEWKVYPVDTCVEWPLSEHECVNLRRRLLTYTDAHELRLFETRVITSHERNPALADQLDLSCLVGLLMLATLTGRMPTSVMFLVFWLPERNNQMPGNLSLPYACRRVVKEVSTNALLELQRLLPLIRQLFNWYERGYVTEGGLSIAQLRSGTQEPDPAHDLEGFRRRPVNLGELNPYR